MKFFYTCAAILGVSIPLVGLYFMLKDNCQRDRAKNEVVAKMNELKIEAVTQTQTNEVTRLEDKFLPVTHLSTIIAKAPSAIDTEAPLHDAIYEGAFNSSAILDYVLQFAGNPVESRPDLDYESEDYIAFSILGLPKGMSGHFCVDNQSFDYLGKECRTIHMNLEVEPPYQPYFKGNAARTATQIKVSLIRDESNTPIRIILLTFSMLDHRKCEEFGINPDVGIYRLGVCAATPFGESLDSEKPWTLELQQLGMVNSKIVESEEFPAVSYLIGKEVSAEQIAQLNVSLEQMYSSVKGLNK